MLRTWLAAQLPAQARAASKTMTSRHLRFLIRIMANVYFGLTAAKRAAGSLGTCTGTAWQ